MGVASSAHTVHLKTSLRRPEGYVRIHQPFRSPVAMENYYCSIIISTFQLYLSFSDLIMADTNIIEMLAIVMLYFKLGLKIAEAACNLYYRTTENWLKRIKSDDLSLEIKLKSGRSSAVNQ